MAQGCLLLGSTSILCIFFNISVWNLSIITQSVAQQLGYLGQQFQTFDSSQLPIPLRKVRVRYKKSFRIDVCQDMFHENRILKIVYVRICGKIRLFFRFAVKMINFLNPMFTLFEDQICFSKKHVLKILVKKPQRFLLKISRTQNILLPIFRSVQDVELLPSLHVLSFSVVRRARLQANSSFRCGFGASGKREFANLTV